MPLIGSPPNLRWVTWDEADAIRRLKMACVCECAPGRQCQDKDFERELSDAIELALAGDAKATDCIYYLTLEKAQRLRKALANK
jgi:hypothetical protein